MARTILITGATGFTGGKLARRLAAQGECVRALVRDRSKAPSLAADGIDVRVGQLTSLTALGLTTNRQALRYQWPRHRPRSNGHDSHQCSRGPERIAPKMAAPRITTAENNA